MHRYYRFVVLLVVAGISNSQAATPFGSSMPVDLVRYLSGGGTIYSDEPPNFPDFMLPDNIRLMGSHDQTRQQNLLYRTTLTGAQAQQAMVAALEAEGWLVMAERTRNPQPETGFVLPARPPAVVDVNAPVTLCHDENGNITIEGRDGSENRVFVRRYAIGEQARQFSCAEQNQIIQNPGSAPGFSRPNFVQYLPRLDAAIDFIVTPRPFMGIGGSNGLSTETRFRVSDWSPEAVGEHYAAQLREQGWQRDTGWAGGSSAGSNWSRSVEDDLELFLTLLILETEQNYTVKLDMKPLP